MEVLKVDMEDELYPQKLLEIKNFPSELYVVGNIELLENKNMIAVVGSRNCTEYGRKIAYDFSKELSQKNICIVSGMAIGIDTAAHCGALEGKGKTVAVLGSGFNHINPVENEWLFNKILQNGGCIISEYAPNIEAISSNFPKRNRIISGLSKCTLVVEAGFRSGSRITAKYAKLEGKNVYVIPSNIDHGKGLGSNILIQEGAKLVIRPSEIIKEEFAIDKDSIINAEIEVNNKKIPQNDKTKKIKNEYLEIYRVLSSEPIHINEISKKLGRSVYEITPTMTMMELDDFVSQIQTNYYIRKEHNLGDDE